MHLPIKCYLKLIDISISIQIALTLCVFSFSWKFAQSEISINTSFTLCYSCILSKVVAQSETAQCEGYLYMCMYFCLMKITRSCTCVYTRSGTRRNTYNSTRRSTHKSTRSGSCVHVYCIHLLIHTSECKYACKVL